MRKHRINFTNLHPATSNLFAHSGWGKDVAAAVIALGGEIMMFKPAGSGGYDIGYRLHGSQGFHRVQISRSKPHGQAIAVIREQLFNDAMSKSEALRKAATDARASGTAANKAPELV